SKARFFDTYDLIFETPPPYVRQPVTRNGLFELAACVGKSVRPSDIDKIWPKNKEAISLDEAFEVFTELKEIELPKKDIRLPTENLFHRLQRMDLPGEDRFFMEKYWKQFTDERGDFEIQRFARVLAEDREIFLDEQDDLRAFWQEERERTKIGEAPARAPSSNSSTDSSKAGEPVSSSDRNPRIEEVVEVLVPSEEADRPVSMQESTISEDPLADGKSSSGCGFLSLSGGRKHCVGVYFTVAAPTLYNLSFRVKRHSHIPDSPFKHDVIGYVKNEDSGEITAVTTRVYRHEEDGEVFKVFGTGTMEFAAGSYHFAVTNLDTKARKEDEISAYQRAKFVNEEGGITAHFRVLLYDIFDVFDINMNKVLEKSEFDLFTHLSENNLEEGKGEYMGDEEWTKLSELLKFDPKMGMPISAFVNMFKLEIGGGADALNDVAINMRNIGVNPKFEQDRMCPYKLFVSSVEKQQLRSQLFDVDQDVTESLPYFLYDRGEELMELDVSSNRLDYSFNWKLFRAKYFAVLVCR
ncbi:hypothetical protein PMAYCL1PPCAC_07893, partial [Pristionchus mayeri]